MLRLLCSFLKVCDGFKRHVGWQQSCSYCRAGASRACFSLLLPGLLPSEMGCVALGGFPVASVPLEPRWCAVVLVSDAHTPLLRFQGLSCTCFPDIHCCMDACVVVTGP